MPSRYHLWLTSRRSRHRAEYGRFTGPLRWRPQRPQFAEPARVLVPERPPQYAGQWDYHDKHVLFLSLPVCCLGQYGPIPRFEGVRFLPASLTDRLARESGFSLQTAARFLHAGTTDP